MIRGEPIMREAMLRAARAWAKAHRAKLATASWKAHGDSPFFGRLAKGQGSFTARKYDEVMAWFNDPKNWRDGVVSPAVVDLFADASPLLVRCRSVLRTALQDVPDDLVKPERINVIERLMVDVDEELKRRRAAP